MSLLFSYIHAFILIAKAEAVQSSGRPAMSEEEVERRSRSIIDEFLHINDYKVPKRDGHFLSPGPRRGSGRLTGKR